MEARYDAVVIGGGPAGLAAAIRAKELGLEVLLVENRERIGGIPLQCVHPGFGLHYFKEDLTGTEFIYRLIRKFEDLGVEYYTGAHVLSATPVSDLEKRLRIVTGRGVLEVSATTLVYAAGARERHLFEIGVTGKRLAGVYTAGEAQAMMDLYGVMPGRDIVIVGSGDVGLIMARRFVLEGARVRAVVEIMPYPGGLTRNIVQCLEDFGIPLYLSHAVTRIEGKSRVEAAVVVEVDENLEPIPGTEERIPCDTVVVAAGLVPYIRLLEEMGVLVDPATRGPVVNEYLESVTVPGVFVAGNALVINDLIDYVVEQGEWAAESAKLYVDNEGIPTVEWKPLVKGRNIRLAVPHYISGERDVILYARVRRPERNVVVRFPEANLEVRMPVVRPAEMIRRRLSRSALSGVRDKLTMEVVPA